MCLRDVFAYPSCGEVPPHTEAGELHLCADEYCPRIQKRVYSRPGPCDVCRMVHISNQPRHTSWNIDPQDFDYDKPPARTRGYESSSGDDWVDHGESSNERFVPNLLTPGLSSYIPTAPMPRPRMSHPDTEQPTFRCEYTGCPWCDHPTCAQITINCANCHLTYLTGKHVDWCADKTKSSCLTSRLEVTTNAGKFCISCNPGVVDMVRCQNCGRVTYGYRDLVID